MIVVTSVEQSKRLIEAGINPATADMRYVSWNCYSDGTGRWCDWLLCLGFNDSENCTNYRVLPAWSFSAIWDLMSTTNAVFDYLTSDKSQKVLDSLVETLIRFAKQGGV